MNSEKSSGALGTGDIKEILGVVSAIVWFERDLAKETYPQHTNAQTDELTLVAPQSFTCSALSCATHA